MTQEMKYVYAVYEEGSFLKAAEKLFITQPALSIAVQKAEQSIGLPIFDRNRRPFQLTEAGKIYIDTVKETMLLEKKQEDKLNDIRNITTGNIKLGGSNYLNSYILPRSLVEFNKKYPGIKIEIVEAAANRLSMLLASRELDVTFSCNPEFIKNFERYRVFEDHVLLAVPTEYEINKQLSEYALTANDIYEKKHLDKKRPALDLSVFSEMDFIILSQGNNLYDRSVAMFKKAGFTPNIKMQLGQLVTAYYLAANSMGVTFTSDLIVQKHHTQLTFYKLDYANTTRVFYALLPNKEYISKATRAFIQHMHQSLKQQFMA